MTDTLQKKMKWTRNRWGDYFATAENASYRIEGNRSGNRTLTRYAQYTGPDSLGRTGVIARVNTLKEAQELAEIDRYHDNQEAGK